MTNKISFTNRIAALPNSESNKLFFLKLLFAIVSIFACGMIIFTNSISLMLIPLLIFVFYILASKSIIKNILHLNFFSILAVFAFFIRYFVYPLLFCLSKNNSFFEEDYSTLAFIIFLVEEFLVITFFEFLCRKCICINSLIKRASFSNGSIWLIIILSLFSVAVLLAFPAVRYNYQFIWNVKDVSTAFGTDFSSLFESIGYVVVDATRLLLPLLFINICYKKDTFRNSATNVFVSFLACIIPMLIIKNMNRGSSFFASIIYLWIVVRVFGWKRTKYLFVSALFVLLFLLVGVSLVKHNSGISTDGFNIEYVYRNIEAYSIGIESLRFGLITNRSFDGLSRLGILFNDIVCSLPIVNRFGLLEMRYTSLFNSVVYAGSYNSGDNLAPILTHGIYMLGIFGFLAPIIMMYFSFKTYAKAENSNSINHMFAFIYMSWVFESGRTGSFTATLSTFIWVVLPVFLFTVAMDKIRFSSTI